MNFDKNEDDQAHVNRLLKNAFTRPVSTNSYTLREAFELRCEKLDISPSTAALEVLNLEWRTLNGLLDGTQKRVDYTSLPKLARFLGLTYPEVIELYLHSLDATYKGEIGFTDKGEFIINNFDLANLKKAKIIDSINDFYHIEKRLEPFLGLDDILDYDRSKIDAAFSASAIEPKNTLTRDLWLWRATSELSLYQNPFEYNQENLVQYFPTIRQHSINVEYGLFEVIRSLYKLGITVIFQPYLPTLHLRGATIAVKDKPCIILTDYKGYYPTLWFALIHELFHVLFDWSEIRINKYHLSEEDPEDYAKLKRETEANNFASEYLFPKKDMNAIRANLNDDFFLNAIAKKFQVHPSVILALNAFEKGKDDPRLWGRLQRRMPEIELALSRLYCYNWSDQVHYSEIAKLRNERIFFNLK